MCCHGNSAPEGSAGPHLPTPPLSARPGGPAGQLRGPARASAERTRAANPPSWSGGSHLSATQAGHTCWRASGRARGAGADAPGRWDSAHVTGRQVGRHERTCGFASASGEGKGPSKPAVDQVPTSLKQTRYSQALESSVGEIDSFYVFVKTVSFLKTYMERVLI